VARIQAEADLAAAIRAIASAPRAIAPSPPAVFSISIGSGRSMRSMAFRQLS